MASSVNAYPGFRIGESESERVSKLNTLRAGKINGTVNGIFTLTANAVSSPIQDALITVQSVIAWHPTTSTAAQEIGGGTLYVLSQTNGVATVSHVSSAATNRTYRYQVIG